MPPPEEAVIFWLPRFSWSELREAHPENRDVGAAFDTLLEQGEIEGPALEGTTETDPR